jgi:UDP-GlcNAc:undecaprenyl-phosphate GlcNAc-1-phosphate transferase
MPTRDMASYFLGTMLPAAIIAWLMGWVVRRWAVKLGFVDQPNARKVHTRPIPLGGGLAIAAGVLLPFAVGFVLLGQGLLETWLPPWLLLHREGVWSQGGTLALLLTGAVVLCLLGLADDIRGVDWRVRLGVQFAVAAVCVGLVPQLRLSVFLELPWLTNLFSVVWIVALVNAFNMLDNMDGLSAGVAALAGTFLAAVLLIAPNPEAPHPQIFVAGLLLVLVGSLLGFLPHNQPPARLFMGDAGSYFLGFLIAVASLLASYTGYRGTTQHAILAPLFVLAVPWYDLLSVIVIRLRQGRSPFDADKNHFSHRLVELGFTKPQAVQMIYLVTVICGLAALLLHRVDRAGAGILIGILLCLFLFVAMLEATARRTLRKRDGDDSTRS